MTLFMDSPYIVLPNCDMLMTIEKWMSLLELSIAAEKFELSWKSKALIQLLDRQLSKSQKNAAYHYVMLLVVQIKRWNKFHSLLSYSMKLKFSKRKEKYNRTELYIITIWHFCKTTREMHHAYMILKNTCAPKSRWGSKIEK